MAKSLRSKSKRASRSKKREGGVYAAEAAARLHRLNAKLLQVTTKDEGVQSSAEGQDEPVPVILDDPMQGQSGPMDVGAQQPKVSTHGPRGSRREEWRKSKGLPVHPSRKVMNRQGGLAGRRKAGRSKRRR